MKINEIILKKLINIPKNIEEITNKHIVEIENFEKGQENDLLVVGHVLTKEKHPNADTLSITTVDLGNGIIEQIVCGASNIDVGQDVVVAKVGMEFGDGFKIKEAKIRGVQSHGMICSLKELGYDEKNIPDVFKDGIYFFDEKINPGTNAYEALHLKNFKMELGLTPNRGDLLSHLGYAYDLSAMTNEKVKLLKSSYKTNKDLKNNLSIKIETNNCKLYYGAIADVKVKESPEWLKAALLLSDVKPINNVVDITNYVLLTYGTPLHAFDYNDVGDEIIVRQANNNEKVITLDEEERILSKNEMLITSKNKPLAIAGIMGLDNSKVKDDTSKIILEAAFFDNNNIQKSSKRLNLRTDSSLRFERSFDINRVKMGLDLALSMLEEYAEAKIYDKIVKAGNEDVDKIEIETTLDNVNNTLGISLKENELLNIFSKYRYDVKVEQEKYLITPPNDRLDLKIEADIFEEVGRFYGLDEIKNKTLPSFSVGKLSSKQLFIRSLRHFLSTMGLNEVITYSLLKESEYDKYYKLGDHLQILNPLSEDKKVLRQSLINGLLDVAIYNNFRKESNINIFEIGHVYAKDVEVNKLAVLMHGIYQKQIWTKDLKVANFFLLKGILNSISKKFKIDFELKETNKFNNFHPYRQAIIISGGVEVGFIAQVHPKISNDSKLKETYVLELSLDNLSKGEIEYNQVSRFPVVERDLAVIVEKDVEASAIEKLIKQTLKKDLLSLEIFDVFVDPKLGEDKKSVAMKMLFSNNLKTYSSEEIEKLVNKALKRLEYELKAEIRK